MRKIRADIELTSCITKHLGKLNIPCSEFKYIYICISEYLIRGVSKNKMVVFRDLKTIKKELENI